MSGTLGTRAPARPPIPGTGICRFPPSSFDRSHNPFHRTRRRKGNMAFRFELGETFLTGIPRIARENISSVITLLSENPRPTAESVHGARKSLKSLRAVLQLARGGIESEFQIERIFCSETPADRSPQHE